jgi:hypothetical protein
MHAADIQRAYQDVLEADLEFYRRDPVVHNSPPPKT